MMSSLPILKDAQTRIVSATDITQQLAAEWDDLARCASEPNSFYERWFVEASLRHLTIPDSVQFLFVRDDRGTLVGMLPLRTGQNYGRMPLSALQNWLHYNQFLGVPLVRKGSEDLFWGAVIAEFDESQLRFDILYLSEMLAKGPVTDALFAVCRGLGRSAAVVHRYQRALLVAGSTPDEYWTVSIRKKKRKEITRLENRLSEIGEVRVDSLREDTDAETWIAEFLSLEAAGWKALEGAALAKEDGTRNFFLAAIAEGLKQGRVEILRLRVGNETIAMLVNFLGDTGSFSFKIAYNEDYARYSPGILIEKANLQRLADPSFSWMDSCAVEDHPMINSLWRARRDIVRIALPRKGLRAAVMFRAARLVETGWSAIKQFRNRGQNDNGAIKDDHEL
jgi:CelD/BcsL family acetyltransferase involved in cellulose biosynthesis